MIEINSKEHQRILQMIREKLLAIEPYKSDKTTYIRAPSKLEVHTDFIGGVLFAISILAEIPETQVILKSLLGEMPKEDIVKDMMESFICEKCGQPKVHYRLYGYKCSNCDRGLT